MSRAPEGGISANTKKQGTLIGIGKRRAREMRGCEKRGVQNVADDQEADGSEQMETLTTRLHPLTTPNSWTLLDFGSTIHIHSAIIVYLHRASPSFIVNVRTRIDACRMRTCALLFDHGV